MAQNYTINSYQTNRTLLDDLQLFENNFECLRTLFAGTSDPMNNVIGEEVDKVVPGMTWFHTTNKILKIRNAADDEWLGVMQGNSNMKIYLYKNSATLGWTVDSSIGDKVLAFKGGVEAYDTTGGDIAGTWTQPSGNALTIDQIPAHTHGSAGNHRHKLYVRGTDNNEYSPHDILGGYYSHNSIDTSYAGSHTHSSVGGGNPHNHGDTYRPYAAIGTLQYINI